jgi:hypothetical protein
MEQDKSRMLQLEKKVCDLENQLSNEWECHQSKTEQTFMKLESNVATVHQKLVEEHSNDNYMQSITI